MTRTQAYKEKRPHGEGVGPWLLTMAGHKGKRLHEGGVGPEMLSPVGLESTPQRETPLSGRLAGDAISGGLPHHSI